MRTPTPRSLRSLVSVLAALVVVSAPARGDTGPKEIDNWAMDAQVGAIWNEGNSNSLAFSGALNFKRDDTLNILKLGFKGTYVAGGDPPIDETLFAKTEAANWQVTARYERNFGKPNTQGNRMNDVFAEARVGGNPFAGYVLRPEATAGVGRYFVRIDKLELRGEIGANYQIEYEAVDPDPEATPKTDPIEYHFGPGRHYYGARAMLSIDETVNQHVAFNDSIEATASATPERPKPGESTFRVLVTNIATLTVTLSARVNLKLINTFKVNTDPAPEAKSKWDNTLDLALSVRFL